MRSLMRSVAILGASVVCCAALAACGSSNDAGGTGGTTGGTGGGSEPATTDPYLLGFAGDFTGPLAFNGVPLFNGFETYIEHVNGQGGVNGRQIQIASENYQADVNQARVALETLAGKGALGLFGALQSNSWGPLADLAERFGMPQITIGVTDDKITPPRAYVYGTQLGTADNGDVLVGFMEEEFGAPDLTYATIIWAAAYTDEVVARVHANAGALGWEAVVNESIQLNATDATAQAEKIAAADPDIVVALLLDPAVPLVVRALRDKGYAGPIVNYIGGERETTFESLNDPDYYAARSYSYPLDDSIPAAVELVAQARASGNEEGLESSFFTHGYVQAMIAVEALRHCADPCDGEAFNTALEAVGTLDTGDLSGVVELSPERHRSSNSARMYRWDSAAGKAVAVSDWISGKG